MASTLSNSFITSRLASTLSGDSLDRASASGGGGLSRGVVRMATGHERADQVIE